MVSVYYCTKASYRLNVYLPEALKARLYQKEENLEIGQWIYWKNYETKKWQGPSKIVMIDNKNVITIRNNKLITINKDHVQSLVNSCSEWLCQSRSFVLVVQ